MIMVMVKGRVVRHLEDANREWYAFMCDVVNQHFSIILASSVGMYMFEHSLAYAAQLLNANHRNFLIDDSNILFTMLTPIHTTSQTFMNPSQLRKLVLMSLHVPEISLLYRYSHSSRP